MAEVAEQFGPYTRVRRLGAGGMAETFLAVQRGAAGFEQRVCMKFILPAHRQNTDFRRLFLREASIAASLRHSNIVGVIDVDEAAGYLVLELVDGVDLRALLNAAPNHRLPYELATLVTIELCKALAYAHGRKRKGMPDGVVHRDVSASNVLISYAGEVKLTDFGVARAMRAEAEPLSTTVKGKLCYMSPEQARGVVVDGRSDLFSLGILFYELMAGQRPFDGATDAETLLRITAGQHRPLMEVAPEVPAGLASVVERMLARDRDERFASADAVIDALTRFAPRLTAFRELGDLARATRPHQTLPSYEVLALEQTMPSGLEGRRSVERASRPSVTRTQQLADGAPPIALRTSFDMRASARRSMFQTSEGLRQALRHVRGNAWSALGAALLVSLAVATAWTARITSETGSAAADAVPNARALAAPAPENQPIPIERAFAQPQRIATTGRLETSIQPSTSPMNSLAPRPPQPGVAVPNALATPVPHADAPAEQPASEAQQEPPMTPLEATHVTTRSAARRAAREAQKAASEARRAERAQPAQPAEQGEGLVHVGVIPMGQVWIDGRLIGWTPVETTLNAGTHKISAGATKAEVHKLIKLGAGETKKIVLNLEDADEQAETTETRPDR